MGRIGRTLYRDDEISARAGGGEPVRSQTVVKFLGGCNWQSGPPTEWRVTHDRALRATALAKQADTATVIRNRPVPRTAGCQYSVVDNGGSTFYFY